MKLVLGSAVWVELRSWALARESWDTRSCLCRTDCCCADNWECREKEWADTEEMSKRKGNMLYVRLQIKLSACLRLCVPVKDLHRYVDFNFI